ncbi:cytochrome P460 family protein [Chitinophaga varians]|uniref:cytochrome P460 family protein n=1 Tax=Chitinophaga varians TaxID=2202339 RepID=UPI00165FA69C|nr:cytochrome P460 family protein [Chitinophaga varians]MBC9911103.1 heme-binding domain-containing protein [Chitinophaga varians]
MKKTRLILALLGTGIIAIQFCGPEKPESVPAHHLTGLPDEVNNIIRNSCFDCHSSQTTLRWYDKLSPINQLVYSHIQKGRQALDFSKWDSLTPATRTGILYYSLNKILEGEMPLPSYTTVHPAKSLSNEDIQTLKQFLMTKTLRDAAAHTPNNKAHQQRSGFADSTTTIFQSRVLPAPNGIEYIPDYRNWKVISITDRFDNGTMRIIYGNEIAVKAILECKTNPWPDGSIFAKAAWKQQTNADGSITAGDFVQVEFMIKDAHKYATTAGWGWARWRGPSLKPYGDKAIFTAACISCHTPQRDNDYVFTHPFTFKH